MSAIYPYFMRSIINVPDMYHIYGRLEVSWAVVGLIVHWTHFCVDTVYLS